MLTLFIAIVVIIRLSRKLINHEKFIFYKEFYNLLFIIYLLLLYYLLLSTDNASSGLNLTPFKEIIRYPITSIQFIYNVIGNIVLFLPFGFFISDFIKAKKTYQILIISALISLTAELIQFKIGRAFDIDDIILNVTGAIIGFLCYKGLRSIKRKLPSFIKNNIFYNLLAIIVLIIMILLFGNIWGLS
jgi:glycopeptide antibiotics resistance protein